MTVRTRFAPSPTGYLHIGGVRTALFNWLFARHHGGKFILRIDDTDTERNRPEALQPILDGFRWLGIDWDEGPDVGGPHGPYFQSQRQHLYVAAAMKLLDAGHAYPDYLSKEELDAERKEAEAAKRSYVHRGKQRDTSPAENRRLYDAKPTTLRLKVEPGRTVAIDDQIRGRVEWQTDLIGDPVILRANGTALYNFATVVDDVALEITHVVRAAEHLSNTQVQMLVYEAVGAKVPVFAHVPLVFLNNKKMSKRDADKLRTPETLAALEAIGFSRDEIASRLDLNPIAVAFYRELGYLPAALVNYLGRLGWSMDATSEVIPLEQMIANFSLERVNNAPGNFDPQKLLWLAGEYMRMLPLNEKVQGVLPFLRRARLVSDPVDLAKVRKVIEICGDRLKLFADVLTYAAFLFRDPVYDPQAVKKRLHKEGAAELLRTLRELLAQAQTFEAAALEAKVREFAEGRGLKFGDLNHVLRVATTGVAIGPGMYDCLEVLGKEESLRRIEHALTLASGGR
jgi:nondiscriminating glutamyl-tRNA synthetase